MKIPAQLPQFINESVLLLVSGTQAADFYLASESVVVKVGQVKLPKNHYSDREDFGRRGSNVFESGSKIEKIKKAAHQEFLNLVKSTVKDLVGQQKINSVYLFAPAEIMSDVKKVLPTALNKKIKFEFVGNVHKEKVLDVLKKTKKKPLK